MVNFLSLLKNFSKKILTIILIFLISLTLLEISLRTSNHYLKFMENSINGASWVISHPIWDHWHQPELTSVFPGPGSDKGSAAVTYHFDNGGFRIPKPWKEYKNYASNNSTESIFVMGDSFTVGYYFEDTFSFILDKNLNGNLKNNKKYRVHNAGVASQSPLLYFLRYKSQIINLKPKILIVNVDLTDIKNDAELKSSVIYDHNGTPEYIHRGVIRTLKDFLRTNFYVVRVMYALRVQQLLNSPVANDSISTYKSYHASMIDENKQLDLEFMLNNLRNLIKLAKTHNTELVITTYPHLNQITPDRNEELLSRRMEYRIKELCVETSTPFFSAFDGLSNEVKNGKKIYLENDMHLSPLGQKAWAQMFANWFLSEATLVNILNSP